MTQKIKDKLAELRDAANDICYQLWRISEDESLTREERDMIESYAIDADQLAINIKSL
jgi:hypothetical protein